ncbi:MAG: hypothetical protein EOP06_09660 [Proteobacteria bacterium]|nr:MAG: hypothetical protein EOP06_09660 [Pseudomonadota bacterium]
MGNKSAKGLVGFLLGDDTFRVYDKDDRSKFTDYTIRHNDLQVVIEDDDAFIYEKNSEHVIDYSQKTLGREKMED